VELGLKTLTLADVLEEMKSLNSRFSLWMAGHSQGAAVMQVFCHKLMNGWGVLPQNMLGYGFASPTVATGRLVYDPAPYPLFHVLNSDDVIPRMGALVHLGLCLEYQAGPAIRSACYGWNEEKTDAALRESLKPFFLPMTDTLQALEACVAFCYCLLEEKAEEYLSTLMDRKWTIAPIGKALSFAEGKAQHAVEAFADHARRGYRALADCGMSRDRIESLKKDMRPVARQYTLRQLLGGLHDLVAPPHTLAGKPLRPGSYHYIALEGFHELKPFIWTKKKTSLPIRQFARATQWGDVFQPLPGFQKSVPRRGKSPAFLPKGPMGRSVSALRRLDRSPKHFHD
jgi:hypothetical protein